MATAAWTDTYSHNDDAGFQYWSTDVSTRLQTAGLVQTADTGQVNLASATRPGTGAYAGYHIYYLNDALHATNPLYIKIEWGTGNNAGRASMRITLGTGTDGAGTLTSPTTPLYTHGYATVWGAGAVVNNYLCVTAGAVWVILDAPAASGTHADNGFVISRTCNASGADDGFGASLFALHETNQISVCGARTCIRLLGDTPYVNFADRFVSGLPSFANMNYPLVDVANYLPGDINGDTLMIPTYAVFPAFAAMNKMFTANDTAASSYTTVATPVIGATSHTFIQVRHSFGYPIHDQQQQAITGTAGYLIWE